jgi:hypothetical protein
MEIKNIPLISIVGIMPLKDNGVGGVATHILRLSKFLSSVNKLCFIYNSRPIERKVIKANGLKYNFINIIKLYNPYFLKRIKLIRSFKNSRLNLILLIWFSIFKDKSKVFHIHNEEYLPFFYLIIIKVFKKKIVFTIHDPIRLQRIINNKSFTFLCFRLLAKSNDVKWIAVNNDIMQQIIVLGANPNKVFLIPAYLKDDFTHKLNTEISNFKERHKLILSIYGAAAIMKDGTDLYGIDLSIKLLSNLVKFYPNCGLIIILPGNNDSNLIKFYEHLIVSFNLQNNIIFQLKSLDNLKSIYSISDVFLRPTITDGDSICVREALDSNCIVVASDIVSRPDGCIVFNSRNLDSFTDKVIYAIDNREESLPNLKNNSNDFLNEIINVYSSF